MRRPPPLPALPPPSAPPTAQRAGPEPGGKRSRPTGTQPSPRGPGAAPPASSAGSGRPQSHLPPGQPRRAPGVRSAHSGSIPAERGRLRTGAHHAEGSAVPQPRQPIILPLLPKANEAEAALLVEKACSLRSIPWCRSFSRAAAPQSPLVSDFWAGRERSGALMYPAELPPGCPRGPLCYPQTTCERATKKVKLI